MPVSRRKFLKAGTMVSLSVMIPVNCVVSALGQDVTDQKGLFKVPTSSQTDERLTEETFARYLNSTFVIYTTPLTTISLELIKVKHWEPATEPVSTKKAGKGAKMDSFSVLFRGPRRITLESKTYRITHDQMGTFDLFISPVDDRKKQRLYQAVFSRVQS